MINEKRKQTADKVIFNIISLLLLISFFEESEFSQVSAAALVAVLLLPVVIVFWFLYYPQRLTKTDLYTIAFFALMIIVQVICIRWDSLYTSITPIYRSLTVLLVVLYVRKFKFDNSKGRAITVISFIAFLFGLATIFTPNARAENPLYGNYNTVGALFFTLAVVDLIIYFKTRKSLALLAGICCTALIILSNTRTALFLLLIMLGLFVLFKILPGNIVKPKIILPILIILLAGFIWFYYDIKSLSIYTSLNKLSKALFNKNFDSGRPDLWHLTVEAVGDNWLLGRGTGIDLEDFYYWTKTPHSVYFDLYLQNGLLGVVLYLICIFIVIKGKGKWCRSNLNLLFISIVFVLLFYNSVGIVITKPRSGIGLLQWALIALPYVRKVEKNLRYKINDKLSSPDIQCKTVC